VSHQSDAEPRAALAALPPRSRSCGGRSATFAHPLCSAPSLHSHPETLGLSLCSLPQSLLLASCRAERYCLGRFPWRASGLASLPPILIASSGHLRPIPRASSQHGKLSSQPTCFMPRTSSVASQFQFSPTAAVDAVVGVESGVSPQPEGKDSIDGSYMLILTSSSHCSRLSVQGPRRKCGDASVPAMERRRTARSHVRQTTLTVPRSNRLCYENHGESPMLSRHLSPSRSM
jgi:hypothetical protein